MNLGVFTTLKVQQGIPLFFDKHQERLLDHAKKLGIKLPNDVSLEGVIKNFINDTKNLNYALRITIRTSEPQILIDTRELPPTKNAVNMITILDTRDALRTLKTTNRVVNEQAKQLAEKNGADDALFVQDGNIIESTIGNIFSLNKNGQLITPPIAGRGLNGITRQIIMNQTNATEETIPQNTEGPLMLVNSLRIQKVNYLDGKKLRDGEKIFQKIKLFIDQAETETRASTLVL